jgi:hypothetical protein
MWAGCVLRCVDEKVQMLAVLHTLVILRFCGSQLYRDPQKRRICCSNLPSGQAQKQATTKEEAGPPHGSITMKLCSNHAKDDKFLLFDG